jgi:FkbM family methyltransferase
MVQSAKKERPKKNTPLLAWLISTIQILILTGIIVGDMTRREWISPWPSDSYSAIPNDLPWWSRLKQQEMGRWSVWNRTEPLLWGDETNETCVWAKFNPQKMFKRSTDPPIYMCTYPRDEDKYVSASIQLSGFYGDCRPLVGLWGKHHNDSKTDIYLEIGVNIGSCLMEILFSTNATIVAFEPDPRNLAKLTLTLMNLDVMHRNRVFLYPIALGDRAHTNVINRATDNSGNAVVEMVIRDEEEQQIAPPVSIEVDTLDSIFEPVLTEARIALIKMDTQGFECRVMDGAIRTFQTARVLKTELAQDYLKEQGCTTNGFLDRIERAGFVPNRKNLPLHADIIVAKT